MTDEQETEGLERPTSNDVGEQTLTKADASDDGADEGTDEADADDETEAEPEAQA